MQQFLIFDTINKMFENPLFFVALNVLGFENNRFYISCFSLGHEGTL